MSIQYPIFPQSFVLEGFQMQTNTHFHQPGTCFAPIRLVLIDFFASVCFCVCLCIHIYHVHNNYITYIAAINSDLSAGVATMSSLAQL